MITVYLFSPKTEMTFYIFAVTTGFTWLATVPPTAGIVGKLFWHALSGHTFWADVVDAPDWRVSWRVAGRSGVAIFGQSFVGMAGGYRAGPSGGPGKSAHQGGQGCPGLEAYIINDM